MRASFFLVSCVVIAGCHKLPAADGGRIEKPAARDAAKPPPKPGDATPNIPTGKPAEARFDLVRDTARVRKNLAGTWYQVDHQRDGTSSTLTVVWLFADETVREEYWSLEHKDRSAMHGTDRGRWELRGDTIVFHFEGQPAAPAAPPPPVHETKPAPPPATPDGLLPAAPPVPAAAPAPAAANEAGKPRDDEQRLLQAAPDWFTYEYRSGGNPVPPGTEPPVVFEGVSVRVANDFKLPRFIQGYRREGEDIEPPTVVEKFIQRIFR